MNGAIAIADTNVLIYLLRGDETAASLLEDFDVRISFITHIELLSFIKLSSEEQAKIEKMIQTLSIVQSNPDLIKAAIRFRKEYNLEVPDAIIAATSYGLKCPLLTGDKVFSRVKEIEVIWYN